MKADISRDSFNPDGRYSRVVMQQGRPQVDADFNESTDLLLHQLRTLAADMFGNFWGPETRVDHRGNPVTAGFGVEAEKRTPLDFEITPGPYYVNGLRCVASVNPKTGANWTFLEQQFFSGDPEGVNPQGNVLVYLDAWERLVTAADARPGAPHITDAAFGGLETAARTEIVWRVRVRSLADTETNVPKGQDWPGPKDLLKKILGEPPMLAARIDRSPDRRTNPCSIPNDVGYRGVENQLYRVEIHPPVEGQASPPRFKWSRDNGSVAFAVAAVEQAGDQITAVTLRGGWRDSRFTLRPGDLVEYLDDVRARESKGGGEAAGVFLTVRSVDPPAGRVDFETTDAAKAAKSSKRKKSVESQSPGEWGVLRRWDMGKPADVDVSPADATRTNEQDEADLKDGEKWIDLEDGIQIKFRPGGTPKVGDYWLIPARVGRNELAGYTNEHGDPLAFREPHGIVHHYAPLALIDAAAKVTDLRRVPKLKFDKP